MTSVRTQLPLPPTDPPPTPPPTPAAPPVPIGEPPSDTPTPVRQREVGGPEGPEPTRFGDWERKGRCSDF